MSIVRTRTKSLLLSSEDIRSYPVPNWPIVGRYLKYEKARNFLVALQEEFQSRTLTGQHKNINQTLFMLLVLHANRVHHRRFNVVEYFYSKAT
eukprot:scaffold2316_cov135-Skeletonema_menzelii.AAC.13